MMHESVLAAYGRACTSECGKPFVALLSCAGTRRLAAAFHGEERRAMEYEIEDEERLFDDSTNPSLKRRRRAARPVREPAGRRSRQSAAPQEAEPHPRTRKSSP